MPHPNNELRLPTWEEMEIIASMSEAEKVTGLSRDTIKRVYPEWIIKLSPRRRGVKRRRLYQIAAEK